MPEIKKVAVIGAGVMGAGIAAQVANAGVEVLLLDIVPKDADDRNIIAKGAIQKLIKSNPAALMHKRNAKLMIPGNIDDDLKKIKDCDWIVEAVIERLDIKQDLYKKIEKHRKKDAVVSSNTSTIPLEDLTDGLPDSFAKYFMITHFFNPPRYMRLLEIVSSKKTLKSAVKKICAFGDERLGKSIVHCNDTPGFIANRIGTYWLHASVMKAMEHGIGVEEADAVLSRPAGVPKTGVFGLLDLVGLDLMPHILGSLSGALPKKDAFHALGEPPALLETMIKDGYTGRKGKGGFYRLNKDGGKKVKEVISLKDQSYSKALRPKVAAAKVAKKKGLRAMLEHDSAEAKYAWDVLSHVMSYSAELVPEIADNIELVDRSMKLGYNWKLGPFELIDKVGSDWLAEKLKAEGRPAPKLLKKAAGRKFYKVQDGVLHYLDIKGKYQPVERPEGVILLEDIKRNSKPVFGNFAASVWDAGDGVACLEFHTKMNALNPFVMNVINKAVKELPDRGFKGMVVYNEAPNFCVGANIAMFLIGAKLMLWPLVSYIVKQGQDTVQNMKYADFPIVGAPSGMALGGGCEILLHCSAVEAHVETYIGLVEVGVGIVPGWGGCKELLGRWAYDPKAPKGPMTPVMKSFETIAVAAVAKSAVEAKDYKFFRPDDGIIMNRDRVLANAKARVLSMAKDYKKPEPFEYKLPGDSGAAALGLAVDGFVKRGLATPHDATISTALSFALSGGNTDVTETLSEDDILKLERKTLIKLAKTKESQDRVAHMLTKGKPLRN